jgi:hypothetical protein
MPDEVRGGDRQIRILHGVPALIALIQEHIFQYSKEVLLDIEL